jgi:hypothetical protein
LRTLGGLAVNWHNPNAPPNKLTLEQALNMDGFHKVCEAAKSQCPQHRFHDMTDEIMRNRLSPLKLFRLYLQDDLLWDTGYHEELPPREAKLFADYREKVAELQREFAVKIKNGEY